MAEEETVTLVLLLLGALLVLPLVFMGFFMPMTGMMGTSGWGMGLFGLGWLFPLLFLALLAWALYRATTGSNDRDRHDEDRAIDVLRESYARGEIDDEEFERRLRTLRNE